MTPVTDGTVKFIVINSGGVLPGTVTAFSGTFKDGFPVDKNTGLANKEWHLCDGTNGTPDLRNRFIYGGDGTNNGATGGEASVTLTKETIPAHDHTASCSVNGNHTHGYWADEGGNGHQSYNGNANWNGWTQTGEGGSHSHTITIGATGGNQPHNNMPPYYVLAFIMKL